MTTIVKKKDEIVEKSKISVFAVLLAGGQSSRLFPFNKIFSDLTGSGRTLLQQAYDRITKKSEFPALTDPEHFFALASSDSIKQIRAQLHLPTSRCFADPLRRGTWPALLWAIAHLRKKNPNAVVAVFSADHSISDVGAFKRAARQAIRLANERPVIATLGVTPTDQAEQWQGYGALRSKSGTEATDGKGCRLQSFEEKPSLDRAKIMMKEKGWVWNAGMFFFRIPVAEEALHVYQPAMSRIYERMTAAVALSRYLEAAQIFSEFPEMIEHPFSSTRFVSNTIDYAIMSPLVGRPQSGLSAWIAKDLLKGWMDVGEWSSLAALLKPDRRGNMCVGRVRVLKGVKNCTLAADAGMAIEIEGLSNFIVAFSGGRALIIPKVRVAEVKLHVAAVAGPLVAVDAGALDIRLSKTRLIVRPK